MKIHPCTWNQHQDTQYLARADVQGEIKFISLSPKQKIAFFSQVQLNTKVHKTPLKSVQETIPCSWEASSLEFLFKIASY